MVLCARWELCPTYNEESEVVQQAITIGTKGQGAPDAAEPSDCIGGAANTDMFVAVSDGPNEWLNVACKAEHPQCLLQSQMSSGALVDATWKTGSSAVGASGVWAGAVYCCPPTGGVGAMHGDGKLLGPE